MNSVAQRDWLGCGIACTAFILGLSYNKTKQKYFQNAGDANKTGYYCRDLVAALSRAKKSYDYSYVGNKNVRCKNETIVFIKRSKRYPCGHYLVIANVLNIRTSIPRICY